MDELAPLQCQIALKEWASVVQAFARGEQLVLIRKGGLAEAKSGFTLASKRFLFYPTFEHQAVNFLRSPYRHYLEEALAHKPSNDQLRLDLFGLVVFSTQRSDPSLIERLQPFHIYNEAFVMQRLQWQPDQPLVIAVVRAFYLPSSTLLPVVSRYAGCKSWVDLEHAVQLDGSRPVLDDEAFGKRLEQIRTLVP